jgi:aspartyl-tRNA(Asn)/glutamyl-tRNA(Gln) amidotransferase subunit A
MSADDPGLSAYAQAVELAGSLERGETTSVAITQSYLERIERVDPELNAFVTTTAEIALRQAERADERRAAGETGTLLGLPIAYKDLFCTEGVITSCGSRMLANFVSPYTATVVGRLERAGMVMLGKTNMDEFAMGSSNENSYFGACRNPWDRDRVPGGSSGGSAAAVAAGMAPLALGTDTGGSIRQPAAFCGLTGIKPTYGRASRFGMVAFASSFDQAGVFARSARDAAHVLSEICGFDELDSTSVDRDPEDFSRSLLEPLEGLRVGVLREHLAGAIHPDIAGAIEGAIDVLRSLGAEIVEARLPNAELGIPTYYVLTPAEASSNLARYDGVRFGHRSEDAEDLESLYKHSRAEGFGPEVRRRIMVGTYALSAGYYDAYYGRAQRIRRLISDDYQAAFTGCDVLLGPTTPDVAFRIGEKTDDPLSMYMSDIFTIGVNLAGLCGVSLPVGFSDGMPIGMQLIGNHFAEGRLLQVAHQFQGVTEWHRAHPAPGEIR